MRVSNEFVKTLDSGMVIQYNRYNEPTRHKEITMARLTSKMEMELDNEMELDFEAENEAEIESMQDWRDELEAEMELSDEEMELWNQECMNVAEKNGF